MKTKILTALILLFTWLPVFSQPHSLTCEYLTNPLGIDVLKPRLSWVLPHTVRGEVQTAYRITVSSTPGGSGDLWNSGKVVSSQSVHVEYKGSALTSGMACYWKVETFGVDGTSHGSSEEAFWTMGLLEFGDWKGKWIGAVVSISSPLLRKEFPITKEIKRATAYISGLGWNELYINGEKVGDHVLDPGMTTYDKRVLYVTHDVTNHLVNGMNAIGVMLGNGWLSEPPTDGIDWWLEGRQYENSPRLLLQINIEFTDGTTAEMHSDPTWKTSGGPIIHNGFFTGEEYDARLEKPGWKSAGYNDSEWDHVSMKSSPGGIIRSQLIEPIKVNQTLKPISLSNPQPGVYVYDFGQLFGGWTRLHVQGSAGDVVEIKYSPRLYANGLLDKSRHPERGETDFYTLKGGTPEIYEPTFTYHPVRYVQIEGYPGVPTLDDLEGRVVHNSIAMEGDFECSKPLINAIHKNVTWTFTNGLFSIPLDCLHREHVAWTDAATITGNLYVRKSMGAFWTKWLNDIADSQYPDGGVTAVVPLYTFTNFIDAAWGGNYPMLVWYFHQYYGDNRILQEHYDGMKKLVDHFSSKANCYILSEGHFGDHMLPGDVDVPGSEQYMSEETPTSLVWTAFYYRGALVVAKAAELLGRIKDAEHYRLLAEDIKNAFNSEWLDRNNGEYGDNPTQTANLLPLITGIVPEDLKGDVLKTIVKSIMDQYEGHHHTGTTGTLSMIEGLTKFGKGDVMYEVATQTNYPGWGYMVEQGATTIWENWGLGVDEESMIMWCMIDQFFYNDLAGIKGPEYMGPGYMAPGFKKSIIRPYIPDDLTYAKASMKTMYGSIVSDWKKEANGVFTFKVTVPANTTADIHVPKIDYNTNDWAIQEKQGLCWQNGAWVSNTPGITLGFEEGEYIVFQVGSGEYRFQAGPEALLPVVPQEQR